MTPPKSVASDAPSTADDRTDPAGGLMGAGNLETVRDILFGQQIREVDRRFQRLEERLAKEAAELKDDIARRFAALEQHTDQGAASLGAQIRTEQAERSDANARIAREIAETNQTLVERATALDAQLTRSQHELQKQLGDQHQELSQALSTKVDEVLAALARESQALRHDKTDRAALANLLRDVASRLADDGQNKGHA